MQKKAIKDIIKKKKPEQKTLCTGKTKPKNQKRKKAGDPSQFKEQKCNQKLIIIKNRQSTKIKKYKKMDQKSTWNSLNKRPK